MTISRNMTKGLKGGKNIFNGKHLYKEETVLTVEILKYHLLKASLLAKKLDSCKI